MYIFILTLTPLRLISLEVVFHGTVNDVLLFLTHVLQPCRTDTMDLIPSMGMTVSTDTENG